MCGGEGESDDSLVFPLFSLTPEKHKPVRWSGLLRQHTGVHRNQFRHVGTHRNGPQSALFSLALHLNSSCDGFGSLNIPLEALPSEIKRRVQEDSVNSEFSPALLSLAIHHLTWLSLHVSRAR